MMVVNESQNRTDCYDMDYIPVIISKFKKVMNKSQSEILSHVGLKGVHTLYLICLYKNPQGMTQKELTAQLEVDKANTTRAIRELIEKKCVCRARESAQRNVKLTLTKQGESIAKKLDANAKRFHDMVFSAMTPQEKEIIQRVLCKVDSIFTAAAAEAEEEEER